MINTQSEVRSEILRSCNQISVEAGLKNSCSSGQAGHGPHDGHDKQKQMGVLKVVHRYATAA